MKAGIFFLRKDLSNPRRRLKTGGAGELWVLGGAIALLTLGIYLANGGGITQKVSQNLGLRDGIVQVYNENAATHHVYASITGYWASDRTNADGKYLIVGLEGKEFIVSNGKGIYKTGEQIIDLLHKSHKPWSCLVKGKR